MRAAVGREHMQLHIALSTCSTSQRVDGQDRPYGPIQHLLAAPPPTLTNATAASWPCAARPPPATRKPTCRSRASPQQALLDAMSKHDRICQARMTRAVQKVHRGILFESLARSDLRNVLLHPLGCKTRCIAFGERCPASQEPFALKFSPVPEACRPEYWYAGIIGVVAHLLLGRR